jgi:pimeloyl-ACP methyl ester carboxylesterase
METRAAQWGRGSARTIVYVPGFDPRGGRYYARVFAEQLAVVFGDRVAVRRCPPPRRGWKSYRVCVSAENGDHETRLIIASWEQVVLSLIRRRRVGMVAAGCHAFAMCCLYGVLWRLYRLNWRFALTCSVVFAWPTVCVVASIAAVCLFPLQPWSWILVAALGLSFVGYWWIYLRNAYRRYLLWSWSFGRDLSRPTRRFRKTERAYDDYIDDIVRQVRQETADSRETVLIGHSVGALQAVRAASLLSTDASSDSHADPGVTLLTLGGSWPIVTQYVGLYAARLRDDVRLILANRAMTWIDVCAWEDVLSCPDTKNKMPLIAGMPVPRQASFEYVDPELPTRWPPDFYRRNVRNFSEIHFDYLLPPRVKNGFDLFRLFVGESVCASEHAAE